jgi:hypothetical protein
MNTKSLLQIIPFFLISSFLFSINLITDKMPDICCDCLIVDLNHSGEFSSYEKSITYVSSKVLSACSCHNNYRNFKSAVFSRNSRTYRSIQQRIDSGKLIKGQNLIKSFSFVQIPLVPFWIDSGKNKSPDGHHVLRI